MAGIKKLGLKSKNITEEQKAKLKELFPEVFTEDKIDFDKLRLTLGSEVDDREERFGMTWPGKRDCFKVIQEPSIGTLKPCRDESVNWDKTENLFIEGDNLEVLKLLQKSYYGKVKVVCIDPPYNTGNEFIYPDKFSESLETYFAYTGQVDAEGRKFSTNTEADGRFHSKWLNMMYPRLFLAKNLLREDGVTFISIDDHEVSNLRKLCDEILGEENFVGQFVVNSTPNARDYGHMGKMHEYVLFYAKNLLNTVTYLLPDKERKFKYKDQKGEFNIHPLYNSNVAFTPKNRPNLFYPFYIYPDKVIDNVFFEIGLDKRPNSIEIYPSKSIKDNVQFVWRWGRDKAKNELNKEIIGYQTEEKEFRIVQKMRHSSKLIRSLLLDKMFSSRRGTAEVEGLFKKKIFSFPKPFSLLKNIIQISTKADDLILDFFSGSCTTAHATLDINEEDSGRRKFIMVQLPEPCEENSEAFKAGYKNIADIGKERIRRVIKKIRKEQDGKLDFGEPKQDLGFKVFKLDKSNFKIWDGNIAHKPIQEQLKLAIDHIDPNSKEEDILYEILLKSGFELTTPVEKLTVEGKKVYSVAEGALLICLEKNLTKNLIRAIAEKEPHRVVCLDSGFKGDDQLKTNAVQIMKSFKVESFRTV